MLTSCNAGATVTIVQSNCDVAAAKLPEKSLTVFKWPLQTCNDGDDVTCADVGFCFVDGDDFFDVPANFSTSQIPPGRWIERAILFLDTGSPFQTQTAETGKH